MVIPSLGEIQRNTRFLVGTGLSTTSLVVVVELEGATFVIDEAFSSVSWSVVSSSSCDDRGENENEVLELNLLGLRSDIPFGTGRSLDGLSSLHPSKGRRRGTGGDDDTPGQSLLDSIHEIGTDSNCNVRAKVEEDQTSSLSETTEYVLLFLRPNLGGEGHTRLSSNRL